MTSKVYFANAYDPAHPETFPGEARVQSRIMAQYLLNMIRWDANHENFAVVGTEADLGRHTHRWQLTDDLTVNFTLKVDRIDRLDADGKYLRFIDYKTGKDKVECGNPEQLFSEHQYAAIFQLMLYCIVYSDLTNYPYPIQPIVYKITSLGNNENKPLSIDRIPIEDYHMPFTVDIGTDADGNPITQDVPLNEYVRMRIVKIIKEIFDPNVDFTQTDDEKNCRYCNFVNICGRVSTK